MRRKKKCTCAQMYNDVYAPILSVPQIAKRNKKWTPIQLYLDRQWQDSCCWCSLPFQELARLSGQALETCLFFFVRVGMAVAALILTQSEVL